MWAMYQYGMKWISLQSSVTCIAFLTLIIHEPMSESASTICKWTLAISSVSLLESL